MAAKKKEGLDGLKAETGGKYREDRNAPEPNVFPSLSIDTNDVGTVILLLQSPENNVRLMALATLDAFLKKYEGNLKILSSLGILEHLMPLTNDSGDLVKRFSFKLIGMLSATEDFRQQMLAVDGILEKFLETLKTATDVVLQEYSSLILANLTEDHSVASNLLTLEGCGDVVFQRLNTLDPDVLKNCLTIIYQLLDDIKGIDVIMESPFFDMKLLINAIFSSYPVIQNLTFQVLIELTSLCKDPIIHIKFRDAKGLETVLSLLENEEQWDLYSPALDLLINVLESPEMCDYVYSSGGLGKFISLLDNPYDAESKAKILGVLARLAQSKKGREALHLAEMETKFIENLQENDENFQEPSCLGIINMSQYYLSQNVLIEANVIKHLLGIVLNKEKSSELRNLTTYALNVFCNSSNKAAEALMNDEGYQGLFTILTDSPNLSLELCQSVIQTFIGISPYPELRTKLINENFLSALMSCLPSDPSDAKDPCIQVDVLECLSEFMVDCRFRSLFVKVGGAKAVMNCLSSRFASVREWAGHLVGVASQNVNFIENFLEQDGVDWMLKEKNTMYSMPSWQSAIESIFSNYLPAKFAYTGRLDFQDITKDGFYVSTNPKLKFTPVGILQEKMLCPLAPVYMANFKAPKEEIRKSTESSHRSMEPQSEERLLGTPSDSRIMNPEIKYSCDEMAPEGLFDPNLFEYLGNLRKRITKEELPFGDMSWSCIHPRLICNRARIIAEFVAEEMAAPDPSSACNNHYKRAHIKELMCHLGTNIFPLGLIRIGDYLERAMLFKVLADRIGFPCALVRGSFGRAWIEISVPVINIDSEEDNLKEKVTSFTAGNTRYSSDVTYSYQYHQDRSPSEISLASMSMSESTAPEEEFWFPKIRPEAFKGPPSTFLKPNAIVDLVIQPGRVLNINSFEAEEYCGAFLF